MGSEDTPARCDRLSDDALRRGWRFTVEIEGHPSLYGIVIALGQWLGKDWLAPLTAARLGPMLLFAIAACAMFYRLKRAYSLVAALGAVGALLTMPRVFAHAHFASFDGPLMSCWMLAWAMSPTARERNMDDGVGRDTPSPRPGAPPFGSGGKGNNGGTPPGAFPTDVYLLAWGAALGGAMSCKVTGWLAPLPFLVYAIIYGDRKMARTIVVGSLTAVAVFWLFNPRLWHYPIHGMQRFLDLNLHRTGTHLDIPTLFFGRRCTQATGLPWYNTLVWTGITVPVGTLVLAAIGIGGCLRRWSVDGAGVLLLLNWLTLIVVRALPGAPVHDAERLILPSFAFLAALAGLGCHFLAERHGVRSLQTTALMTPSVATRSHPGLLGRGKGAERHLGRWLQIGTVTLFLGSASSLVWYAPQWLSYYNLLIGGLRGADAAGMEATYYWDALDDTVLAWLREHTAPDEKIGFASGSAKNLALMERWGVLKRGWRPDDPGKYRWRVVQRRPTFWSDRDRWLVEHETPALVKTIRPPGWGVGPWRLDVPLIEVFSHDQASPQGP